MRLAKAIDTSHDGHIQYQQFITSMKVSDKQAKRVTSFIKPAGAGAGAAGGAGGGAGAGAGAGANASGTKTLKRVPTAELRGNTWDQARMQDVRLPCVRGGVVCSPSDMPVVCVCVCVCGGGCSL